MPSELHDSELKDKELNPVRSPDGLETVVWPKRKFVIQPMTTGRRESGDLDHKKQIDREVPCNVNRDHEPLPSCEFDSALADARRADHGKLGRRQKTNQTRNGVQGDPRSVEIERLLGCASRASIVRNLEGIPFIVMPGETLNQFDVAPLASVESATFLRQEYYAQYGQYPSEARLRVVRHLLDRDVCRSARISPLGLRVARGEVEHNGEPGEPQVFRRVLALDLGRHSPTEPDSVLEIDAQGWSVNQKSSFCFMRPRGHLAIPIPQPADAQDLTILKDLLRVGECDWRKILIWLINVIRAEGPYFILGLLGEARSGKSEAAKVLKSLFDPAAVAFRPLPTNPNTVLRQATQTWVQAYDHITGMSKQISSALCRLATGAAFNVSCNGSPTTIRLCCPIVMTVPIGVSGAAWKPTNDLLDRMLIVTLPPLRTETTRPESEIEEHFAKARPKILGALAQAASVAMSRVDQVHLASYPRHAEAARWAIAAAPGLNVTGESLQQALAQKSKFAVAKDPLVHSIAMLMTTGGTWQGTATELKLQLDLSIAPNHLSRQLKEVQNILQAQGIEVVFPRRQESGQLIRICKVHGAEVGSTSRSIVAPLVGPMDSTSAPAVNAPSKIDRQLVMIEIIN